MVSVLVFLWLPTSFGGNLAHLQTSAIKESGADAMSKFLLLLKSTCEMYYLLEASVRESPDVYVFVYVCGILVIIVVWGVTIMWICYV